MSKLAAKLLAEAGGLEALNRNSTLSRSIRERGVWRSQEFLRVLGLPRRIMWGLADSDEADALAQAVSDYLYSAAGGTGPSPLPLRPMQAAMLVDCAEHEGMLASLPVGAGKSWAIALLAVHPKDVPADAEQKLGGWLQVKCERPVLLLPPSVRDEMERDVLPLLAKTYKLHPNLTLVSYSELQTAKRADILNELRPDFLACDEVHNLKNLQSARTKRVKHWMKANPQTVFAGTTATLSDASLRDFWHMLQWSHPLDAPLPRGWKELEDWANAVDADVPVMDQMPAGALIEFCSPGESARSGLQRRLAETSGFILAAEASCDVPLVISANKGVNLPAHVREALQTLDEAWVTPDGLVVPDAARWAQRSREMSLGFYYVWDWKSITADGKPDLEWLAARSDWANAVRDVCRRGLPDFDSELRVRNGCKRGELPKSLQSAAAAALARWEAQKHKPKPLTVPVWLTDVAMEWVAAWMRNHSSGIVWTEHQAVIDWFVRNGAPHVFAAGSNSELRLLARSVSAGTFPIVCSRQAHFQGKNLQAWNESLVLTPGPSAKIWEQMLGREHRSGQKRAVNCDFLAHTDVSYRSMAAAVRRAKYALEVLKAPQKLLDCEAFGWQKEASGTDGGLDDDAENW